ncbi:MAG TPA: esterase, partial [Chloroflexi bacterium]|nr:esterase [Chloroflexota bacterium]
MLREQIIYLEHESRVLADNPPGDPFRRTLPVYLPPGYNDDPDRRYPVIWVLAPFTSWGERLFNLQAWDENIVQRMDRLVREGKAAPAILIFPDCFTHYGGSQYLNSSAVGRYEDYLIEELIPFSDAHLRTLPTREHRAVLGYSSGGYGALMLAMRHPNTFGAAA